MKQFSFPPKSYLKFILYGTLILMSVLLPIFLVQLNLNFLGFTLNRNHQVFELFGSLISMVWIVIVYLEIKDRKIKSFRRIIPVALIGLTFFLFLSLILEYSDSISGDYKVYEQGAQAIVNQVNLYNNPNAVRAYDYPPLLAQSMAFIYNFYDRIFGSYYSGWTIVFYIYQVCQFFLLLLAYYLCYQFSRNIGVNSLRAWLIVTLIFVLNIPMIKLLRWNQMNLWILNSFLLAILWLRSYPWLSGAAIAVGTHLKLYPIIMLFPWVYTRKWRAIISTIICIIIITFIQTNGGTNLELWQSFFGNYHNFAKSTDFTNSSFYSLTYNTFKFLNIPLALVNKCTLLIMLIISGIFLIRLRERDRIYREIIQHKNSEQDHQWLNIFKDYGNAIDTVAMSLLLSPIVWEHHYVIAIPVAIWALATLKKDKFSLVVLGCFLIFALPTFDIYLLSYHRMIGLLILIYLTAPGRTIKYFISR